jgi:hypothetical protein
MTCAPASLKALHEGFLTLYQAMRLLGVSGQRVLQPRGAASPKPFRRSRIFPGSTLLRIPHDDHPEREEDQVVSLD